MQRRSIFPNRILPYLLLAPQIAITLVFFVWPAGQALNQALYREDPFGLASAFVGIDNFVAVLADPSGRVPVARGLALRHTKTGERSEKPFDGVFVAIGHAPATALCAGQVTARSCS